MPPGRPAAYDPPVKRFRLAFKALLVAVGTALGAWLFASHPAAVVSRLHRRPHLADEAAVADALASRLDVLYGTAHPWQRYLSDLAMHVAVRTRRPLACRIYVVPDGDLVAALPGGLLLVGDRLLRRVGSEAELVALLAQAVAHVDLGHALDAAREALDAPGAEASTRVLDDAALARLVAVLPRHELAVDDEADADDDAFETLTAEGYDPLALARALGRLTAAGPPTPGLAARIGRLTTRAQDWLDRHPEERVYVGEANMAHGQSRWVKDYLTEYRR